MKIADDVLVVLSAMECTGKTARITSGTLDRKLYARTDAVLQALGGRWMRAKKHHLFEGDAAALIDAAIVAGEVTTDSEMGYFPTPPKLAANLVRRAGVTPGMTVLEPSAGEGAIALAAAQAGGIVTCCELDPVRVGFLRRTSLSTVIEADFLGVAPPMVATLFDRVVANPPFARRQDIAHITHAMRFVKLGGLLVAVASAGALFREDRAAVEFRQLVARHNGSIEPLPDGSFLKSGTGVRTVVVTMYA